MEKIFVSDNDLASAINNLQKLDLRTTEITATLASCCDSLLSDLDVGLRYDIVRFVQAAISYKVLIQNYVAENSSAIVARMEKLESYNGI